MKQLPLLSFLALVIPAHADVYRCTGADGATTFSQTPCAASAEKVTIYSNAAPAGSADCEFTENFARSTARLMRQNVDRNRVIEEFGGADAFSDGAMKVVDYVYRYQNTQSVTQERIAELVASQCKTGAFGNISCETLPETYVESGGGCGASFSAHRADYSVDVFAMHREKAEKRAQESAELRHRQIQAMSEHYAELHSGTECREDLDAKIFDIQSRIEAGADPNGFRLELRKLRKMRDECGSSFSPPVVPVEPGGYLRRK